ncbi:DNA-3-methyladenine glycosylase I [Trueperella bonasi]|uniref:DNA-3-methyladenine glycosylase I n=1 Tax=Trueperella bonasi TaxID=312286 RepID=A0ABT9NHJ6_9ACTO|nr:DNA-3-methyladenine glycosylase I [Trueperella bonasi]MDP9806874.1 DNA-3-methyladenine glycosylase I [Trueperella bonasi]
MNTNRPDWANSSELLRDYYDNEWGYIVCDTPGIYERIVLESFQSGLSWETVLKKRAAFREAFDGFDPAKVARYTDGDVERLMSNPAIIRNETKIHAAIGNARATVALEEKGRSLADLVWSFAPEDPIGEGPDAGQSEESKALAKELKRHGFTFVGPITMFALMQAIGMYEHRL